MALRLHIKAGSNNRLRIVPQLLLLDGLLDFDFNCDIALDPSDFEYVVDTSTRYTFNMYMDENPGNTIIHLDPSIVVSGNRGNQFWLYLLDTSTLVIDAGTAYTAHYDIAEYKNIVLDIDIQMSNNSGVGGPISYLKINGNSLTPKEWFGSSLTQRGARIGAVTNVNGDPQNRLDNATLWNLKIYDSSNNIRNSYKGYPNGNTDAAWIDLVGDADGDYQGTAGTRDIEGVPISDILEMTNKLLLSGISIPTNFFEIETYGTTVYNLRVGNTLTQGGNPLWDMGDGSTLTTINGTFSYTYSDPYLEPVSKKIRFSYDDINNINDIGIYGINITTLNKISSINLSNLMGELDNINFSYIEGLPSLDFSSFKKIGGNIYIQGNKWLSSLTFPSTIEEGAENIEIMWINNCPSLGSLDISMFKKLGGSITFYNNSSLTSLNLPDSTDASSSKISSVQIYGCPSLGSINLSGLSKLGGSLYLNSNTSLNSLIFPSVIDPSANNISLFYMQSCPNLTSLDLSSLTKLGGSIQLNGATRLSSLTFPPSLDPSSAYISGLLIYSCPSLNSLDLSMFTKAGGSIQLQTNANLSSLIFPDNIDAGSNNITTFNLSTCPKLESIDVSLFTKMGGSLNFSGNTKMRSLVFPPVIDSSAPNISNIQVYSCPSLNSLDLSMFTKLGGQINLYSNSSLTSITFPETIDSNAAILTSIAIYSCPSLASLDFSMFNKFGGSINLNQLPSLTSLTFPSSIDSGAWNMSGIAMQNATSLSGTLDMSGLNKLGGNIRMPGNKLSQIIFPSSIDSGALNVTAFDLNGCPSLNSLDLSMFTKFYYATATNNFDLRNCTSLSSIEFPIVIDGSWYCYNYFITMSNCALDASTVDQLFLRLRNFYNTNAPIGNVSVNVSGGTNSPPSVDGSTYISELQTIFSNASKTITITVNT